VTPRTALIYLPSPTQSLKYLFGSAFRAPTEYELNTFYHGDGVNRLRPEAIDTHELVWERYANDRLRTSVSTYWYKADRLITAIPDELTNAQLTYVNQGQVRAKGLELEAQMRIAGEARALVSYGLQRAVDQQTGDVLPNSPGHVLKGRMSLPWPTRRSSVAVEGQYLSERKTRSGEAVSGAATLNFHMVHPLGPSWTLIGGVRNIFDQEYSDPVSGAHLQEALPQNGRTARIGLQWNVWPRK
jgi:iron complex outermembrane receptor protein